MQGVVNGTTAFLLCGSFHRAMCRRSVSVYQPRTIKKALKVKSGHMKSYHANSGAGLGGLVASEHPIPEPGSHEVLIRVRANSLNARELLVLRGVYPLPVKPDVVMGGDGSGKIVALGAGVSRVAVGDRVAAAMFPRWLDGPIAWEYAPQLGGSLDGMLTEF